LDVLCAEDIINLSNYFNFLVFCSHLFISVFIEARSDDESNRRGGAGLSQGFQTRNLFISIQWRFITYKKEKVRFKWWHY